MTSSYPLQRLQRFNNNVDRTPEATGYDLAFTPGKDLLTSRGDLSLTSGVEVITAALLRRMSTPPGGYSRYIVTPFGSQLLDGDYDSQIRLRLSQPLTSQLAQDIVRDLERVAAAESRIENLGIELEQTGVRNEVNLKVKYRVLSEVELRELKAKIVSGP